MKRFSRPRRVVDRWFAFLTRLSSGDRFVLLLTLLILLTALVAAFYRYNAHWLTDTPSNGGVLVEGIVGTPRFVNPILAITRADSDLVSLLYSGLMRIDTNGDLVPDLAESVTISDDGTVYNVVVRPDVRFSDGTPLTANDVAYTVKQIQDPDLKSPLRGTWSEVKVEVINDHELNFVLPSNYAPFMENLTLGILPQHTWSDLSPEAFPFSNRNTDPIGSGPYTIKTITHSPDGLINAYTLVSNTYAINQPLISTIQVRFFDSELAITNALRTGAINATAALSRDDIATLPPDTFIVETYPLPRVFTVFMNQNQSTILRDQAVRQALATAIDRNQLIETVLPGGAEPTALPIPSGFYDVQSTSSLPQADIDATKQILEKGGWKDNGTGGWKKTIDGNEVTLSLKLVTTNAPYFEKTANYLKEVWQKAGIEVEVALFDQSDLVQTIIRPRDYELLLFGTDTGRSLDLYPFWHSSQREDPGLNISFFASINADADLTTFRTTTDEEKRTAALTDLLTTMDEETPAIFLYNPLALYVHTKDIATVSTKRIGKISDRFSSITDWYIESEALWPIFIHTR